MKGAATASGNLEATYGVSGSGYADERVSYYDAGGALVAADRRVLVRSRRQCQQMLTTAECAISTIRRTVWDGSSELWEIQMPGHDGTATATMENDTAAVADQGIGYENLTSLDKNPFYSRVAYTYGLTLDQPLSLTRVKYADRPYSFTLKVWDPFTVIPHWNHRGSPDNGSFADGTGSVVDGAQRMCIGTGGTRRCVSLVWPYGLFSYNRKSYQTPSWHGTLLDQKRDETGTLYRRNRYADPMTGRFTQEDPIGLAGGLNLYGVAGGDPVNYQDPFGLCPPLECLALLKLPYSTGGGLSKLDESAYIGLVEVGTALGQPLGVSATVKNSDDPRHADGLAADVNEIGGVDIGSKGKVHSVATMLLANELAIVALKNPRERAVIWPTGNVKSDASGGSRVPKPKQYGEQAFGHQDHDHISFYSEKEKSPQ